MQIKKTFTLAAGALLLTGATLGGVALASSSGGGANAPTGVSQAVENSATDTDNVQEGDQTGPEVADANEAPESESASEAESGVSDGPGGHEDPPGNVDHEFEGEE